MSWDRIEADLERARRDLLSRDFGPGPHTPEIAHHQVQAVLLRRAAWAYEDEARRLAEAGMSPQANTVRHQAQLLKERAESEDASAARLEADQVEADDPQRYAALRVAVQRLFEATDGVQARALGNELIQASGRLGPRAAEAIWRELGRRCVAKGIKVPRDLEPRFRKALAAAADARASAPQPAPAEVLGSVAELIAGADRLFDEAPVLSREDLYDRIVILGGQLKALQEQRGAQLTEAERANLRRGFGTLTRVSKTHQPGWTSVLDSRVVGADWSAQVRAAQQRLAEREVARHRAREEARREQVADALRELHETERRIVFQEAIERLRARLYDLDGLASRGADPEEIEWLRRDARTQAAIACGAANGDEDRLERVAQALGRHFDIVADGRSFRALRRYWGAEEPESELEPETAPDTEQIDVEEVEYVVGPLDDAAWPENILASRGAGLGERVLLVGGIPNAERRRVLRDFFGWREVAWEESYRDHSADFRALRARIRAATFDRVIVLSRFCGHDVTQGLREVTRRMNVHYNVHPRGVSIPALAMFIYGPGTAESASE